MQVIVLHGFWSDKGEAKAGLTIEGAKYYNAVGHGGRAGSMRDWVKSFKEEEKRIVEPTVLVGHSMGAIKAISHTLVNDNVVQCFALAGAYGGDTLFEDLSFKEAIITMAFRFTKAQYGVMRSVFPCAFESYACSQKSSKIFLINSANDGIMPLSQYRALYTKLKIPKQNRLLLRSATHSSIVQDKRARAFIEAHSCIKFK